MSTTLEEFFFCFGTEEFLDVDSDFLADYEECSDMELDAILRNR